MRQARDEYLTAKCGHCHKYYSFDYHRETDAPPAALALDTVQLGPTRNQPGSHRKNQQRTSKKHARDTLK